MRIEYDNDTMKTQKKGKDTVLTRFIRVESLAKDAESGQLEDGIGQRIEHRRYQYELIYHRNPPTRATCPSNRPLIICRGGKPTSGESTRHK